MFSFDYFAEGKHSKLIILYTFKRTKAWIKLPLSNKSLPLSGIMKQHLSNSLWWCWSLDFSVLTTVKSSKKHTAFIAITLAKHLICTCWWKPILEKLQLI